METECLAAGKESLERAAALLRAGQVVAFPTETVYGLGADALNGDAVRAIFAAKERPADNPLIVHVGRREQLEGLCEVTPTAEKLMDAFWPGPLTMLLMKTDRVPAVTTAGLPSVAVRCPDHPVARTLRSLYDVTDNAALLVQTRLLPLLGGRRAFALGDTPAEGAHLLFQRLREMDEAGVGRIFAQGWEPEGDALAVMNRMARAAAFDIVHV